MDTGIGRNQFWGKVRHFEAFAQFFNHVWLGQEYSVRCAVAVDVQTNVASWWYRADRKVYQANVLTTTSTTYQQLIAEFEQLFEIDDGLYSRAF